MIHVLLTPPGERSTPDNLGVFQVGCLPPFAERLFAGMKADGWLLQLEEHAPDWPPDTDGPRARGQRYVEQYLSAHPDVLEEPPCASHS